MSLKIYLFLITISVFSVCLKIINSQIQKSVPTIKMVLNRHMSMNSPPAELFRVWHQLYNKEYDILSLEGLKRFKNFKKNLQLIKDHNNSPNTKNSYTLGLNNFADMALEEFHDKFLKGNQLIFKNVRQNFYTNRTRLDVERYFKKLDFWELPDDQDEDFFELFLSKSDYKKPTLKTSPKFSGFKTLDWIDKANLNSYIENQGSCGSCWAFATAEAIEAAYYLKYNKSIRLSKQQLVDCEINSNGCRGGMLHTAFDYVKEKGIESDYDYPYAMIKEENCKYNSEKIITKISSYEVCGDEDCGTDENLFASLEKGPVAAAVDGSEHFMLYTEGVFDKPCESINHAILLVGYHKTENESEDSYWVVKNSWGEQWGENGFIKIKHHKDYNNCLMHTYFAKPEI